MKRRTNGVSSMNKEEIEKQIQAERTKLRETFKSLSEGIEFSILIIVLGDAFCSLLNQLSESVSDAETANNMRDLSVDIILVLNEVFNALIENRYQKRMRN
jgi:hypothetical protein